MDNVVLDVAFIVAAVGFCKAQLGLKGAWALLCAFVIAVVVELAPAVSVLLPAAAPFVEGLVKVVGLFIAAAGSFDTVKELIKYSKGKAIAAPVLNIPGK